SRGATLLAVLIAGCKDLLKRIKTGPAETTNVLKLTIEQLSDFELLKRHRPEQTRQLLRECNYLEALDVMATADSKDKKHSKKLAKSMYEFRRAFSKKKGLNWSSLIERQFGHNPDAASPGSFARLYPLPPNCLDEVIRGKTVKMSTEWNSLQELFGEERHALSKILRENRIRGRKVGREVQYNAKAVVAIGLHLLRLGAWLADTELRRKVFAAIEHRLDDLRASKSIRAAFGPLFQFGEKPL